MVVVLGLCVKGGRVDDGVTDSLLACAAVESEPNTDMPFCYEISHE